MAIISEARLSGAEATPAVDIEAWTVEQAAQALAATSLSTHPPARSNNVTIEIPLDESVPAAPETDAASGPRVKQAVHTVYRRREPIRRDSQKRRELLLKGKEGSRRRQRWENDRLLNNPYAQPPLPSDWEVQPTYPVHNPVPYFLAPLWEAQYKAKATSKSVTKARDPRVHGSSNEQAASRVPRELREKLKRSRGAKGLLQDLEEEVRTFIAQWEAKSQQLEADGLIDADSEDEEIVFVGRNGAMSDDASNRAAEAHEEKGLRRDKLIFQGLVDDNGAAFGRWLVHSIATYYGLKTWSVTNGGLREAYIGLKEPGSPARIELPRPLYGLV